jgi:hypothetical protein
MFVDLSLNYIEEDGTMPEAMICPSTMMVFPLSSPNTAMIDLYIHPVDNQLHRIGMLMDKQQKHRQLMHGTSI